MNTQVNLASRAVLPIPDRTQAGTVTYDAKDPDTDGPATPSSAKSPEAKEAPWSSMSTVPESAKGA
jgi:hypothetical protein